MSKQQPAYEANRPKYDTNSAFLATWLRRPAKLIFVFCTTFALISGHAGTSERVSQGVQASSLPYRQNGPQVVHLPGYGSFLGTQLVGNAKKSVLFDPPVDAWLGVEYSTQPVGEERFKPVTWPKSFDGTKNVSSSGPACFQNLYSALPQSEACLTLNIYRPSSVSMEEKLPALIYIHGGSFVSGSHKSFDGALFVAKSQQPLMVVTVQYRLGVLGTLPSDFMEEADLLNLGIRDQRMMLEFVQKYIGEFGGDAKKITLSGQSAGGHSVGIHLFHDYGKDAGKPLFSQAILSSGSPTARAFPGVDYPLYKQQVGQFMHYLGCPPTPGSAALKCLRSAQVNDIQFLSSALYNAYSANITWPWQPVSPGPLLEKRGSKSGADGTFFKIPILISSVTDEGKSFIPQDLRTNEDLINFWTTLTPGLTPTDLGDLDMLYPKADPDMLLRSPNYVSVQFDRLAAAFGDFAYICPVQDTAVHLASAGAPVFKARFNTPNWSAAYLGVPHASDSAYFNGQPGAQFPEIADLYSAYWASFVASGDPNTHAVSGAPTWEKYTGVNGTAAELVVSPPSLGGPKMEKESVGLRTVQCQWWRDDEREKRLNK